MSSEASAPTGRAERFDDWFYRQKAKTLVVVLILFSLNIAFWICTNLRAGLPAGEWWVETTGVAVEVGLVLGTIALALAAYAQARTAASLTNVAQQQLAATSALTRAADRQADLVQEQTRVQARPSLAIDVRGASLRVGQDAVPRIVSPGDIIGGSLEGRVFSVRNAGPGVAWKLQVAIRGVGPSAGKPASLPLGERCAPMLGPNESSEVVLPGPILEVLWPNQGVSWGSAIVITVTAEDDLAIHTPGWELYKKRVALLRIQGTRSDNGLIEDVWTLLTEAQTSLVDNGQVRPDELAQELVKSGLPRIRVDTPFDSHFQPG